MNKDINIQELFGGSEKFDDPFLLPSSDYVPKDLKSALDFCLFLYYLNPQYKRASSRVVRHFITDLEFPGEGSAAEKDELNYYLTYQLKIQQAMAEMGDEWACYGNSFMRIHFPFDRYLIDKRSGASYSLGMFNSSNIDFHLETLEYEVTDPKNPSSRIRLPFRDKFSTDKSRVKLRRLDPRHITIKHNLLSGTNRYVYSFDSELKTAVKKGDVHTVNEIPLDMLQAIQKEEDFLFYDDEIFHFKAPTISGISNNGWGLPETLANYRSLHILQVYRKIDETVALDYMMPFRIFTPEATQSESSVVKNVILSKWKSEVQNIVANRRKDKTSIHALPFPVNYQEFGASGKTLTPKDLIEYQTNSMLDAMGYPAELFKGSITVQQIPTAVRLFENSFMFVHLTFSHFCQWVSSKLSRYMGEEFIKVTMSKPSLADNLDRQNVILQLTSAGEISRKKAYSFLGIDDPVEERRERLEEDSEIQKIQMEKEEELRREMEMGSISKIVDAQQQQAMQQGGVAGSPPGGGPGPGSGSGGVSPLDQQEEAKQIAQQMLAMDEGSRRKELANIKATDPTKHALIKEFMEQFRNQAGSQGVQQMYQQMQQG